MEKKARMRNEEQEAAVYALLHGYDKAYRHGRFGGIQMEEVRSCSQLYMYGQAACLFRRAHGAMRVKDFTGKERVTIQKGDMIVRAIGYEAGGLVTAASQVNSLLPPGQERFWAWTYTEDSELSGVMYSLGLYQAALSISASSEYRTLWTNSLDIADAALIDPWDEVSLRALSLPKMDVRRFARALNEVEQSFQASGEPMWVDHYSHYNKRRSWSACALRGYGGGIHQVEKPSEMSKQWKAENPQRLSEECRDTALRELLPDVEPLLAQLGKGPIQRIRLMRLAKGEGELSRHADITDREAGTDDGKILRFHIPIVTNARVLFKSWGVSGSSTETHFSEGRAFYLDTRKAHTAINQGPTDRIHLVVDCVADAERRSFLQ